MRCFQFRCEVEWETAALLNCNNPSGGGSFALKAADSTSARRLA